MTKIAKMTRGGGGVSLRNLRRCAVKRAGFKAAFAASLMAFAALPALADTHSWRGPHGNFSVGSNWSNDAAPSAGDDLTFYRAAANASTWQYATNDLSATFGEIQFSAGNVDIAGNLTTGSGKNLRIATGDDAAQSPFAAVNKSSGNWTVGKDIYIGGTDTGMTGVLTNKAGNITATSGWIYIGGTRTGAELPNVTGTLVNVSGTVKTAVMVIGGRANNTKGRLEIRGGTVEASSYHDKMVDNSTWVGVLLGGWGGANSSIYVAKGGTMKLSCNGANIVVLDGTTEIDVDGLLTLNNGSIWPTSAVKEQKKFVLRVGPEGRVEFRSIKSVSSGGDRMVKLDGGTIVPNGASGYEHPLANVSLKVTDKGGTIEVPSGKSLKTGVYVQSTSSAKSSRLIKTGAGTLTINNYFRPAGGLDVREGTAAIQHNTGNFASFNYPLALSGTATVTSGALAFGSGSSLSFDCKSKTSKPTMTVSTSFTRSAEVPVTFKTAAPFAFDDTYTLIAGGKIANTNNFTVASATANGVDITGNVYLAVESGNLVLKRKPYFMIKVR